MPVILSFPIRGSKEVDCVKLNEMFKSANGIRVIDSSNVPSESVHH
jgi:hypothetical protein